MERAENTARMLDVNFETSLLPQSAAVAEQAWRGTLSISELRDDYEKRYGAVVARQVVDYMVRDPANVASIFNCLKAARENARAVRGTLTTEVWETTNQTWLEFKRMMGEGSLQRDPSSVLEWVKFRSHLSRGVTMGTMLQDEAFRFIRIGSFLERADNTARLLDVKFHAAEFAETDATEERSEHYDFYHWSAVLRSVSAFEIYRKVYRNVIQPEKVADLLILRHDMPRSLAFCLGKVLGNLQEITRDHTTQTMRQAGRLHSELAYSRIDEILATGLHPYLTQFLDRVAELGAGISRDFLVPTA
jgi:uncharacterized alpha-E superfamily protein